MLVAEGFVNLEDVAQCDLEELSSIQGFDNELAKELIERATEFLSTESKEIEKKLTDLKVKDDLRNFEYLNQKMILKLAEKKILTLDDLGELDSEELLNILRSDGIEDEQASGEIIMAARAHWFDDEEKLEKES